MFAAELKKGLALSNATLNSLESLPKNADIYLNLADHYLLKSGLHISKMFVSAGNIANKNLSKNINTIDLAIDCLLKARRYYLQLLDMEETLLWVDGLHALVLLIKKSIILLQSGNPTEAIELSEQIYQLTFVMYVGHPHRIYVLYREQINKLRSIYKVDP